MSARNELSLSSANEGETLALGRRLAGALRPGDVVALRGDMGAGKTRLVRGIAEALGVEPALVSSPTYVLVNVYPCDQRGITRIVHVDAYRLSGEEDLGLLGWDQLVANDSVVVVEWAERIEAALPPDRWDIRIDHAGPESRALLIAGPGGRGLSSIEAEAPAVGRTPKCRICGAAADPDGASAPFCSERCRMVDLGKWFSGSYKISREMKDRDLEEGGS